MAMSGYARWYANYKRRESRARAGYKHYDSVPDAKVRLVRPYGGSGCYIWEVIDCPYCGKKHRHGAGVDPARVNEFLSHRRPHCFYNDLTPLDYLLVLADGPTNEGAR